jgi:hypothetical protein
VEGLRRFLRSEPHCNGTPKCLMGALEAGPSSEGRGHNESGPQGVLILQAFVLLVGGGMVYRAIAVEGSR